MIIENIQHDFSKSHLIITADEIKKLTGKEPRILCKQDFREDRPKYFIDNDLFILPTKNGTYIVLKGDGYVDIPDITTPIIEFKSKLEFSLESALVGDSEMQHLDYAFNTGLINEFTNENKLYLSIRGRKYTPKFTFKVNDVSISTESVQTEVDSGYESIDDIILMEAKNKKSTNTIIRQLFYPYRQWSINTNKSVRTCFFEKRNELYYMWEYTFDDQYDYNSIRLVKSTRYKIV